MLQTMLISACTVLNVQGTIIDMQFEVLDASENIAGKNTSPESMVLIPGSFVMLRNQGCGWWGSN